MRVTHDKSMDIDDPVALIRVVLVKLAGINGSPVVIDVLILEREEN